MISFICDRCKQPAEKLFEAEFVFTEIKIGEQPDGEFCGNTHVCEKCSDELEAMLGIERGQVDPQIAGNAEIAAIVADYVRFKREAAKLKHERVISYCFRAEPNEGKGSVDSNFNWVQPAQEQPCWKGRDGGENNDLIVKPEDWCDGCKYRQQIHELYRAATKNRGIAERRLMQRIAKTELVLPPRPAQPVTELTAEATATPELVGASGAPITVWNDDDIPF